MNSLPPRLFAPALAAYGLAWKAAKGLLSGHKRLKHGYAERLAPENWAQPVEVWIQAASGGEAYLTEALLRRLAQNCQGATPSLLLTTCTLQGYEVLQRAAQEYAGQTGLAQPQVRYFPLDEPKLMARALAQAAPKTVLLLETELWPGLLWACKQAAVPAVVGNGRLTVKSLSHYRILPDSWWEYLAPQKILAVSGQDQARFAALFGADRVGRMSNIKFESLLQQESANSGDVDYLLPPRAPVALFASVRKAEVGQVAEALELVRQGAPGAILVLAPRHLHHVPVWQKALARRGLAVKFRSQAAVPFEPGDVVIWDKFGELKALYATARAAFVGGSLAPLGGQNFLEPLSQGLVPVMGPSWNNFAWAEDFVAPNGPVPVARDAAQAAGLLLGQLAAPLDRERVRADFVATVARHQGGTEAVLSLIGASSV